jgi:hypothetical protein
MPRSPDVPVSPGRRSGRGPWAREWTALTLGVAAAATVLDAGLLQRRHSLFTGGFLSVDHLKGPGEIAVFLAGSIAADAALGGVLAAVGLWLSARCALGAAARRTLTVLVALGPIAVADAVSFRILSYLGSAFDFGLMFDLVGRRPAEILAVAGGHIWRAVALLGGVAVVAGLAIWLLNRRWPRGTWSSADRRPGWRTAVGLPLAVALLGLATTTALRLERESFDNGLRRKPSGRALGTVIAALSDFDRDGWGLLTRPADSAPFDARVHPYAVDWPGNGVDENGVGGDLPAGLPPYDEDRSAVATWPARPDIVFVFLETFRADAVGRIVDGRAVTPVIDAIAARGVSIAHAYSHNGYTVQSRFHTLTGSLASLRGGTSLIDDFNANGYETAYFSGQDESFGGGLLPTGYERARVFYDARQDRARRYTTFGTAGSLAVPAAVVLERIGAFLDQRDRTRPLFLYVNFHDTHFPYHHGGMAALIGRTVVARDDIAPGRRDDLQRMYWNAAANVDHAIGELVARVARTTGREPAVIVTADHGESLFDEGFLGHGYALNDVQTRVPLVAANLALELREPWGHADLRDDLRAALSREDGAQRPSVRREAGGRVFQYLGSLERPAQIGFVTTSGRTIYDFRADRFLGPDGAWTAPAQLVGPARAAFLELLHYWERMMVAQARAASR